MQRANGLTLAIVIMCCCFLAGCPQEKPELTPEPPPVGTQSQVEARWECFDEDIHVGGSGGVTLGKNYSCSRMGIGGSTVPDEQCKLHIQLQAGDMVSGVLYHLSDASTLVVASQVGQGAVKRWEVKGPGMVNITDYCDH